MILEMIASKTRERVAVEKKNRPLKELIAETEKLSTSKDFPFERALKTRGISFICEVKKASPSKGIISKEFPYIEIAKEYEKAGASAISVLTEPFYFGGNKEYIREIKKHVTIPILRKDFIIDEYMIYEAKEIGADAILLICTLLDDKVLKKYIDIAHRLGLSCLVEAHNGEEVKSAVNLGARILGVNNRNLKDFTVDVNNSIKLKKLVSENIIFISESGIKTPKDIENLKKNGVNGVLIGETLMRSKNKVEEIRKLRGKEYEN